MLISDNLNSLPAQGAVIEASPFAERGVAPAVTYRLGGSALQNFEISLPRVNCQMHETSRTAAALRTCSAPALAERESSHGHKTKNRASPVADSPDASLQK